MKNFNVENKKNVAHALSVLFKEDKIIPKYILDLLIDKLMWVATEYDDDGRKSKYRRQRYWSIQALKLAKKNIKAGRKYNDGLRHEHSVPRSKVKETLKGLPDHSFTSILSTLVMFAHSVVITKKEDALLTKAGQAVAMPSKNDLLSRYKKAGIAVVEIDKNEFLSAKRLMDLNISKYQKNFCKKRLSS